MTPPDEELERALAEAPAVVDIDWHAVAEANRAGGDSAIRAAVAAGVLREPEPGELLRDWAHAHVRITDPLERAQDYSRKVEMVGLTEAVPRPIVDAAIAGAQVELRQGGGAAGGLVAHTLPELLRRQPEIVDWVCYPYIAQGDVVSFESPPKDGKTTFVLAMVHAIASGGRFLGEKVSSGPVLYCTEERVGTFLGALERTGNAAGEKLHVVLLHEAAWRMKWAEVIVEIARLAAEIEAKLVVIDTLSKWAGLTGDDEFSAGVAMATMTPLQHLASTGCGVVVIRHERKAGGAVGQAGRGSTAWTGEMDAVIAVRRMPDERTKRLVAAIGRHDETPEERVVDFATGEFQLLGDPVDVRRLEEERQVIDALNYGEAAALPLNELRGDVSRRTAERILGRLIREGMVGHGLGLPQRGGRPRVYWLKEDL